MLVCTELASAAFLFNSSGASDASALKASIIGRYPVQRHKFPSNEFSTSRDLNPGFDFNKLQKREMLQKRMVSENNAVSLSYLYWLITNPGVQKPHCVALI